MTPPTRAPSPTAPWTPEDALRLVHCHPESQIQDIGHLKHALAEVSQFYAELRRLGAPVEFLDVGGGLGVDYDGSRRDRESVGPDDLGPLTGILAETYFSNFSIFQSLPDTWAIDQLFPVMPVHRLDERPERRVVLGDMTCDSDGKLDRFTDVGDARTTLPVHHLRKGEPYYLAAVLAGTYKEILGDLHNLYGDTHAAHVRLDEEGGWWVEELVRGDSCSDVLGYVHYDPGRLYPRLEQDCERAVREGELSVHESRALLEFYDSALDGYTYLGPGVG